MLPNLVQESCCGMPSVAVATGVTQEEPKEPLWMLQYQSAP